MTLPTKVCMVKDRVFPVVMYRYKKWIIKKAAKTLQSCLTLCNPVDFSLLGSSVHGILQARIPEWVAISFYRGTFRPKDQTHVSYVSCIGRLVLYHEHHLGSLSECWLPKNWCFQIVVLEKTLESPSDSKEIKPVNPKGNQPWIFIGKTDAETPMLWPPDVNSRLIGKDPDAGKDWKWEEKGVTEDEMVGWHYQLNGHEFEQTLGNSEGQRNLVHCSPWGSESDTTEWLNNICLTWSSYYHLLCQTLLFTRQPSTLFFLAASFYRQWKRLISIPLVSRGGILFILFKLLVHYRNILALW